MDKKKLQQLVDLNEKIKSAKALFDELKEELMPEFGAETLSVGEYNVMKYTKQTPKLKADADVEELIKLYPEYIKFDVAKFSKENKTLAAPIVDYTVSEVLSIKAKKK